MLNKQRVLMAFQAALQPSAADHATQRLRPRSVAHRAHRIYCAGLEPGEKRPSPETFRKFACGPLALPEVVEALGSVGVRSKERGRLNTPLLQDAFRRAAAELLAENHRGSILASDVARRAHEIYGREADPSSVRPSYHSFRRLVYGKTADREILQSIEPALGRKEDSVDFLEAGEAPAPRRARLDRGLLSAVFREAVQELKADLFEGRAKLLQVARRAHALYVQALQETNARTPKPSVHAFQKLVYGKNADPELAALIAEALPDQRDILKAFECALRQLDQEGKTGFRPRTVAVRAHEIYCAGLAPDQKRLSLEAFRKRAIGRQALPEVGELLAAARVLPTSRARLDRERLRAVFEEAIQRLEARILRGQAKPAQVARRAYEIYTRDTDAGSASGGQPSRHTFQRLVYGKTADPEILTLLRTAQKGEE